MSRVPTDLPRAALFAAAALVPALGLCIHHDLGHHGDMGFFHDWYLAFREGGGFYRDGPGLNYPIVGVLVVCLPARLIDLVLGAPLDGVGFRWVLKTTLACAEFGAIVATARLARTLEVPRPNTFAIGLAVLPCTWAPGAWFGQIDVVNTALLLVAFERGLVYARTGDGRALLGGVVATHLAILTKQLVLFTLPALGLLAAFALARHRRGRHIALVVASPLTWFLADPWLALPGGWHSHLAFVLFGGGSAHADFIVAGGASLWSLIADLDVSAHEWTWLGVSAYHLGIAAFAAAQVYLLVRLVPRLRDASRAVVLYAGLTNLAMATLLTGVHERYAVHGAPLILLGLAALRVGRAWWGAAAMVLVWWGLFVLGSLHFDAFRGVLLPFRMHQPIAVLLLVLFAALLLRARARPFQEGT